MEKSIIRKISVGRNYPDGAIHYQVGKYMNLQQNRYKIEEIKVDETLLQNNNILAYNIYISDNSGKVFWKRISDVPVVVENNIDFE